MKLRFLILSILLPLHSFGATNAFDNVKINTSFKFIPGAASGRVLTSDAVGLSSWQVVAPAGNVFTTSNNTFIAGRTNTFNGQTITSNLVVNGTANFTDPIGFVAIGTNAVPTHKFEIWGIGSSHVFAHNTSSSGTTAVHLENSADRGLDLGYSGSAAAAQLNGGPAGEVGYVATDSAGRPMMVGANSRMYIFLNGNASATASAIGFFTNSPAATYHFGYAPTTNSGTALFDVGAVFNSTVTVTNGKSILSDLVFDGAFISNRFTAAKILIQ